MKSLMGQKMKLRAIIPCAALLLNACSATYPPKDTSTIKKINAQLKEAATAKQAEVPVPEAISASLLPPLNKARPRLSGKQLEQRFDLVVTAAPINQVLMGIAHDTSYSIILQPRNVTPGETALSPAVQPDSITLKLKNVTVFDALDTLRDVYGYDYTVDGTRVYVQPPELQTRLYQVNYILGQRRGVSDLQVIGGASVGGASSGASGSTYSSSGSTSSSTSSRYGSVQASALSTMGKADVWGEVEDSLRTVLGCTIPKFKAQTTSTTSNTSTTTSGSSSSGGASRADVSYVGDTRTDDRDRGVDGCADGRTMNISQMTGTILVRAMPRELRTIEKMLRMMQLNITRQVIIEAKIIDVKLNSASQQGINWAGFQNNMHRISVGATTTNIDGAATNGGAVVGGTSLGALLGTGISTGTTQPLAAGLGIAMQFRNFSAMIEFLQTQGEVQVLSSPRIATVNNQKAVLKVGSEEPFVTNIQGGTATTSTAGTVTTPPTLQYQPFFAGVSLDVTPQIDEADNITLHVHPMVNSVTTIDKPSLPTAGAVNVPFAVNTISETDSVVRTRDGQIVVIGGLMTESVEDTRTKVPGIGDAPGPGALFRKGGQRSVKRELVILLKPTIVKDESAWTDDIAATQSRIESLSGGNTAVPEKQ